jgi:hypothetical protein
MKGALLWLLLLGVVLWLWRDALRAREVATRICRQACQRDGLQFLDDTVALIRIRPAWWRGRLLLRRIYAFEFSRAGDERLDGAVTMLGAHLEHLVMSAPQPDSVNRADDSNVIDLQRPR